MKKIGNVKIEYLVKSSNASRDYSDGPVEDQMLQLVTSSDYLEERNKMLANRPSWAMYYHFTPLRGNIVNWMNFKPNTKILEIGAGCGAITEALLEKADDTIMIDALELSEKRALINAHRNKLHENLNILIGNLEELDKTSSYDYIVCIGVLEYAGKFISGDSPFLDFLKKLQSFLKPNGELLLAIENKMGIKYINGAREDHVGKYYESLMGYPHYNGIRTFSKKELSNLFENAGFSEHEFYIPIPDYKIPRVIIHEELLAEKIDNAFIIRSAPAPAFDQPRVYNASEQLLTEAVLKAELYGDMANSYLIRGVK